MTLEGNYTFAGIGAAEAKTRYNEHRTGVPTLGAQALLLSAPSKYTTDLKLVNQGSAAADVRLAHGESTKTVTNEFLVALDQGSNRYAGDLQFKSVTPSSVTITEAGALADIVDDGNGVLHDTGVPANTRGTIDYATGTIDWTYGGAATEPVQIDYTHTDYTEFTFAQTITHTPPGSTGNTAPEIFSLAFGRVVPGSVAFDSNGGALSFVDDGKGNIIETTTDAAVAGSIDYAIGEININASSIDLTAVALTATAYQYNPWGTVLAAGGGAVNWDLLSPAIPEIGSESLADGLNGETRLGILGETRDASVATDLMTQWGHHVEEPYRVKEEYTSFGPGGESNA